MKTKIIYEDDALLVIYKPAGIATQTSKIGQADVVSELKNYLAGSTVGRSGGKVKHTKEVYLGVIHRLDQPVEGLLVFAKTKEAAAKLSAQLGNGSLNKQYYAVISGQPSQKEGSLVDKLYKTSDNRAVVVTGQQELPPEAKDALLQFQIVESVSLPKEKRQDVGTIQDVAAVSDGDSIGREAEGDRISLADIRIETGRFHQIRAQMAHHGMALLGDAKYADEETKKLSQQLMVRNVALCAYSLEILHPISKKQFSFRVKPEGKVFSTFLSAYQKT